ncbi:MAG: hypothetical protein MH204_06670 [Fimbriimonadaceae bacterium]|nr:hypothetical protein [Fimbriimonadaceae bacterium]
MNRNKARDFFSDHYEGLLDPGLSQAFESALASDPDLRADYDAFREVMQDLEGLQMETPETPAFLKERILSRIDQEAKTAAASRGWFSMPWARWSLAGVAAASVFGLLLSSQFRDVTGATGAGILPSQADEMSPRLSWRSGKVVVNLLSRQDLEFRAVYSSSGETVLTRTIRGGVRNSIELENDQPGPAAVTITFSDRFDPVTVVLPGAGDEAPVRPPVGTVLDLARALAFRYGIPVEVGLSNLNQRAEWTLKDGDALEAVGQSLRGEGLSLERRASGLLFLN